MRFLHCSDVHITADYRSIPMLRLGWRRWIALLELKRGRAEAYRQAGRALSRIAGEFQRHGADHFILSGDLTAYALEEEFRGAREALGAVADDPRRCTIIPGNHDVYTPGAIRDARFDRFFGHLVQSDLPEYCREGPYPFVRLLGGEVAVVGLKSARMPLLPGMSFGFIGRAQLSALQELVGDPRLAHRAVLVVVHHAPLTRAGGKDSLHHGLVDTDALFRIVAGPRFAVLHGHIHKRYYHPPSNTQPHTFGAGSSTHRGHEGYWLIEVADGKIMGGQPHSLGEPWAQAAAS